MGKIGKNSLDIQESNRLSILRILAGEDVPHITYGAMVLRLLRAAFLAA